MVDVLTIAWPQVSIIEGSSDDHDDATFKSSHLDLVDFVVRAPKG